MQKHSDDALVAYLDGELDGEERARARRLMMVPIGTPATSAACL